MTDQVLTLDQFEQQGNSIYDYPQYCMEWIKEQRIKNAELQKQLKTYKYMLTFTLKPGADATQAKQWMLRNVINPLHKPIQCYYAEELTEAGVKHWHVVLETAKSIKKSLFKYYQVKYGHIDFSKTKGEKVETSLAYISKEEEPIKLL